MGGMWLMNEGTRQTSGEETEAKVGVDKDVKVVLRLPGPLIRQVDKLVKARKIKTSRHRWLLEAVVAKIEQESRQNSLSQETLRDSIDI